MSKRKPKSEHKQAGRPIKMVPETLQKLEQAFAFGCTDLEACLFADISPQVLYNYQKVNPRFLERKELLKKKPILAARSTVVRAISGPDADPDLALKFLERKCKDEFSLRQENTGADGAPIQVISNIPMTFAEPKKKE